MLGYIFLAVWRHSLVRHAIANLDLDMYLRAQTLSRKDKSRILISFILHFWYSITNQRSAIHLLFSI